MSELDDIDLTDEQMFLELSEEVEGLSAISVGLENHVRGLNNKVKGLEENLKIGLGCDKPDAPEVCNRMIGGKRKRKSRKKRGKGAMVSRMSRKKKLSARKPKPKYVDEAIKILVNDHTYLIADITERGRRIRNLALELEDNAKKGGRRKRKSRRKTKKRRRSRRRKSRRRRR